MSKLVALLTLGIAAGVRNEDMITEVVQDSSQDALSLDDTAVAMQGTDLVAYDYRLVDGVEYPQKYSWARKDTTAMGSCVRNMSHAVSQNSDGQIVGELYNGNLSMQHPRVGEDLYSLQARFASMSFAVSLRAPSLDGNETDACKSRLGHGYTKERADRPASVNLTLCSGGVSTSYNATRDGDGLKFTQQGQTEVVASWDGKSSFKVGAREDAQAWALIIFELDSTRRFVLRFTTFYFSYSLDEDGHFTWTREDDGSSGRYVEPTLQDSSGTALGHVVKPYGAAEAGVPFSRELIVPSLPSSRESGCIHRVEARWQEVFESHSFERANLTVCKNGTKAFYSASSRPILGWSHPLSFKDQEGRDAAEWDGNGTFRLKSSVDWEVWAIAILQLAGDQKQLLDKKRIADKDGQDTPKDNSTDTAKGNSAGVIHVCNAHAFLLSLALLRWF